MRNGRAVAAILGLALGGCAGESEWVPPAAPPHLAAGGVWVRPAGGGGPLPDIRVPAPRRKIHIFEGRTLGYELTVQPSGTYRFRWTTDNLAHHTGVRRFTGSVWTPGHFATFSPGCDDGSCDLEPGDHVSGVERVPSGGERIDWDTLAKDGWDGFSFTCDAPLYFDVNVDGQRRPELLELVTWN